MGWVTLIDQKTGEVTILGDVPVELNPELPKDDPFYGLREASNRAKILRFLRDKGEKV